MFEALKSRLASIEEGNVPCMYLDGEGFVTTGVGHLLMTADDAVVLPWVSSSGLLRACAPDIRAEYFRVKTLLPNQAPGYYLAHTELRLPQATIDSLLDGDVENKHRGLCALLPGFSDWPDSAQESLLDMAFQVGVHGLVKFPKLIAAAKSGDWNTCASECAVQGAQPSRNELRAELFFQAVKQAKQNA